MVCDAISRSVLASPARGGGFYEVKLGGVDKEVSLLYSASPHPSLTTFVPPSPLGKGTHHCDAISRSVLGSINSKNFCKRELDFESVLSTFQKTEGL